MLISFILDFLPLIAVDLGDCGAGTGRDCWLMVSICWRMPKPIGRWVVTPPSPMRSLMISR